MAQKPPDTSDRSDPKGSEGEGSERPDVSGMQYPPCALMTVPLFHATGSHSLFLLSLAVGRKIVLIHKWDVQEAMRLIETERVTNFNGVPTMSAELQAAATDSPYDLSSLKEIYAGGGTKLIQLARKAKVNGINFA